VNGIPPPGSSDDDQQEESEMTIAAGEEFVDASPPYLFPDYRVTRQRAPTERPVELPADWYREAAGPSFERIPHGGSECDLTKDHSAQPIGQRVVVHGRVVDRHREPVPGALIEIWQANAAGRYVDPADPGFMPVDPNFTGWARVVTDPGGGFRITTVKPAAYAQERGTIYRPAHLHVSVFARDLASRLITQCYFEGDPLIDRDPVAQAVPDPRGIEAMVAAFDDDQTESGGYESAMVFNWEIVLRGNARGRGA
jgi:protocatechuate 3,4-dioxygenase, beta subunit